MDQKGINKAAEEHRVPLSRTAVAFIRTRLAAARCAGSNKFETQFAADKGRSPL